MGDKIRDAQSDSILLQIAHKEAPTRSVSLQIIDWA